MSKNSAAIARRRAARKNDEKTNPYEVKWLKIHHQAHKVSAINRRMAKNKGKH